MSRPLHHWPGKQPARRGRIAAGAIATSDACQEARPICRRPASAPYALADRRLDQPRLTPCDQVEPRDNKPIGPGLFWWLIVLLLLLLLLLLWFGIIRP